MTTRTSRSRIPTGDDRTQAATWESEARCEALLQNAADIVLVVDARGRIAYASPALERVLGYEPAAWLGHGILELIHPDDHLCALASGLATRSKPGTGEPIEVRVQHADGSWRFVESLPNNLLDDPNVRGVVHTLRDVTARKRAERAARDSEERLNRFIETMAEAMLIFDRDGRVTLANAAAEQMFGASREGILNLAYTVSPWKRLTFDGRPFPLSDHPYERIRRTGRPVTGTEFVVERADGSRRSISVNASPLLDRAGGFDGVVALCTDVTARKRAEGRLAVTLAQLEEELARAARVQADLLPREVPHVDGFDLAARCVPARDVGGDFYDWQSPAPGLLTLTLGDVMGKGMAAAMLMATVRAAMRAVVRQSAPREAMRYVTAALTDDLIRAGRFVTLFLAQLDVAAKRLAFVDAGHGHSFVRRSDGTVTALGPRGLPIGIDPDENYCEGLLSFELGDALVVFSDGLVDARSDLDSLSLAARVVPGRGAAEIADDLVGLAATGQPPEDDLTVAVLICTGS